MPTTSLRRLIAPRLLNHRGKPRPDLGIATRQRRNSRIIRTDLHNDTGVPGRRRRDLVGRMRSLPSPATRQSGAHPLGHRLCLSGTPIENNLQELWSEFALLMPGLLGDRKFFAKRFRTPIEKNDNAVRRVQLVRRIKPFLLRRTKSEVASDLPAKHTILRRINLAPEQRRIGTNNSRGCATIWMRERVDQDEKL